MPFDMDKPEPVRFYFDKEQTEWIDLVLLDDEDRQEIRDRLGIKANDMAYVPNEAKGNALELVPAKIDPALMEQFVKELNYAGMPAWHLIDNHGIEIQHSLENVNLMLRRSRKFAAFVERSLKQLQTDQATELEAELKN